MPFLGALMDVTAVSLPWSQADQRHLRAAEGYVELGMALDASEALDEVTSELRSSPAALGLRVQVYLLTERWELAACASKHLAKEIEPQNAQWWIQWAYAVRRLESLQAARAILLAAEALHPGEAAIQFNLACNASQLGKLDDARKYLKEAIALDLGCARLALEAPDLEPLWRSPRARPGGSPGTYQ